MRSKDIIKSLKNADKKYIEQSETNNAKVFFEKRKAKNVLSVIASAAACAALAVFIGVNIYNVNRLKPAPADTTPETIAEKTEIPQTENTENISITIKTYDRSIADIKTENTYDTPVNSIQNVDFNAEYNSLSYVLSDTDNLYKCEKTYTMCSTDAIVKYNGGEIEWTYRIDEGANFYAAQAVSDGVVYMKNNGEAGFIDENGKLKWKTDFDDSIPTTEIFEYKGNIYFVKYLVMEIVYSKENSDIEYSPVNCIVDVVSKEDGKIISTVSKVLGIHSESDLLCLGITDQGIIIKTRNNKHTDILTLLGFDGDEKLIISFENDTDRFRITDAAVSGNVLYISGTLRDKKYEDDYGLPGQGAYFFAKSEYRQYGMNFSTDISGAYRKEAKDYNAEEEYNANRSFIMAYSLENEEIKALYASDCSFGGAVYVDVDNGKVFWETVKPKISRASILNDAIIFLSEDLTVSKDNDTKITSLEGCANVIEFSSHLEPVNVSQGGIYAQLILTYPVRFIK